MIDQAVADLRWVLESPSFVEGTMVAPPTNAPLSPIDASALEVFLSDRRSHRVGHYFEDLVHFWLREVRQVEIIDAGVQIRQGKRTVGEIDFLFRDEQGRMTHWEVAVKFFLHYPRPGASHYPGPNASDDFERKTHKLFEQQLQLSREHYPDVEVRQAFVRGQVFYHHAISPPEQLPVRLPAEHLRGAWLRSTEVSRLGFHSDRVGAIVTKPHWLAPQLDADLVSVSELTAQIEKHFRVRDHPILVSLRSPQDLTEVDRVFVVPPNWCHQ